MKIIEKNIDEVTPYENNPRRNDEAVEGVANSIKEFGFKVPIVIDKDNVIIAGHTRLKAAKKLGLKKVPCVKADDLTPEQARAFRIVDNKTQEIAGWNFDQLNEELEGLSNVDMSKFGFADQESVDLDNFFDEEIEQQKEAGKTIECPYCHCKFNNFGIVQEDEDAD